MARDPDYERISKKAHELWEAEGRPHGRDQDHWDEAREIIAIQDSQGDTLLPRDTGAEEPIEEADEALRNLADFPNLTDQGENLLTSTDREPKLTATPSARKGRMPKVEVPISDQPGIPTKEKASAPKPAGETTGGQPGKRNSASKLALPVSAPADVAAQPKTASVPAAARPETVKSSPAPKKAQGGSFKKKPA